MIEREIGSWRAYLRTHGEISDDGLDELEGHLREEIENLRSHGLSDGEAFVVAVRRAGKASAVAAEYSKVQSRTLWKQLLVEPLDPAERRRARREILIVVSLALLAGLLSRIPELFGIKIFEGGEAFYIRNISFFIIPVVALYFFWRNPGRWFQAALFCLLLLVFVAGANTYTLYARGSFELLIGIHIPILTWLTAGLVYSGKEWRDTDRRMDFIRFSGESFIYLVLILCGGAVLSAMTQLLFDAIEIETGPILENYLVIIGACAAPVVAVYLADSKRNIIENIAPVLARIFSPLFLLLLIAFIVAMIATGGILSVDRDVLIGFDLLLAVVLGILLYIISARDDRIGPGPSDVINTALVISALVVDIIALAAIVSRIDTFGFTPNKAAALGENIVLLVNLSVSAVLYLLFLIRGEGFRALLKWQTAYLPVVAAWAAVVALLFPVIFRNY